MINDKKIFVASLEHETNSFSPITTKLSNYEDMILYRPTPGSQAPGYDRCLAFEHLGKDRDYRVIRSLVAVAQPSGPTARTDFEALRDEILGDLEAALPVDIVFLVLHGAQMAEAYDDCEGDVISRVREIVGWDVPIGVQLDLHCNLTDRMVENASLILACKEYPHTDYAERARELFDLCEDILH